jgi:hypothetical protein
MDLPNKLSNEPCIRAYFIFCKKRGDARLTKNCPTLFFTVIYGSHGCANPSFFKGRSNKRGGLFAFLIPAD